MKGDDSSEVHVGGYTEEEVNGFVAINDGSIVGLSGLLAHPIEEDVLGVDILVTTDGGLTEQYYYESLQFVEGDRSKVATFETGDIPVKRGDIVTFIMTQTDDVKPEKNSVSFVLLLEQS